MIWQILCFGDFTPVTSLSFLITFYPCEHSLGPIMEILLLSYACSFTVSNKLHDIPSWKHCNWIIKEGYFVLMHLIIMLSWWNKLFMMSFFFFFLLYPKYLQFKCRPSLSFIYLLPTRGSHRVFSWPTGNLLFNGNLMHWWDLPQSLIRFFLEVTVKASMFIWLLL